MTDDDLTSKLLYRFGFVAHDTAYRPRDVRAVVGDAWSRVDVADMTFWLHPETRWNVVETHLGVVVLIGPAFMLSSGASLDGLLERVAGTEAPEVWNLLDELSGRFAVVLLQPHRRWLIHDAFGARSLFYATDVPVFSSHAELLAAVTERPLDPLVAEFRAMPEYRQRGVTYLPGDWTVYERIYGLVPNNYLDLRTRKTVRYWPRQPLERRTLSDFFDSSDSYFRSLTHFLRDGMEPVLGLTGGIDTRAIIAALRANGLPPDLITWLGNYMPEREVPLVEALVQYLGGAHRYVNASEIRTDSVYKLVKAIASRNVGNYRGHAKLTSHMFRLVEDKEHAVFIRGYGGEILRGFYNVSRSPMQNVSVPELFRAFNSGLKIRPPSDEYTTIGIRAFEEFSERANYSTAFSDLGYDVNDVFYWEQRMGMWGSAMHNEMDAALQSMTAYNSRWLYESAFGLPDEVRLTKTLLRELTRRYDEGLADLEVTR